MSVDDRLREAFRETDRSWDEQVPDALATLTGRRRHERAVRRGAAAGLVAAAAVAAVVVSVSQRDDMEPVPSPDPAPSPSGAETNPLDGTWVSEQLSRADVRRAARLAGDPGDAQAMLSDLPPLPFRVVLYVDGDRSSMHAVFRAAGRTEQNADEESITVSDDRVVMQPMFAEGENVHTYVLEDDALRLRFVSTTEGEQDGVPGEAWQRLIYDIAAFTSGT